MAQPLVVRIGADVAPAGRALASFAAQAGTSLAAVSAAALSAGRNSDVSMRGIATSAGRAFAQLVAQHYLAIGAFAAFSAAAAAGAAELERFAKIAEKASASGLGTTFFQAFTRDARDFRLEAKQLESDLIALEKATRDRFDGERASGVSNRAGDLLQERFRGTNDFGLSQSPTLFANAQSAEERVRAVLVALRDMEAVGQKLAAIDLARQLGLTNLADRVEQGRASFSGFLAEVEKTAATGLRDGSLISPELIARAEELKRRWQANTEELSKNMRPILDECARLALAIGSAAAWSAEQFTKLIGVLGTLTQILARQRAEINLSGPLAATEAHKIQVLENRLRDPGITEQQRRGFQQQIAEFRRGQQSRQAQAEASLVPEAPVNFSYGGEGGARAAFSAPVPNVRPTVAGYGSVSRARAAKAETDEWADAYAKLIQNMEKANAQVAAELATVGKSTEERQRALDIAKLEAEARRTSGTITATQRAETERLATANARLSDSLKQAQADAKGLSDALQYGGDRLVDMVFNSRDLAGLWKGLMTEIGRAAITGQGPFAQLLGFAPAAGAPSGTLGGLMGLVQAGMPSGGGAGGLAGAGGGLLSLFRLFFGSGGAAAGAPLNLLSFVAHSGGIVGNDGVPRMVPAHAFAGAPRFHSGGAIRPGERPIIAELGEEILSRRARGRVAEALAAGGSTNGRMVTNIFNNAPAAVRTEQGDDGSLNVFLEAAESHMAGRISTGRGPLPAAVGGFTGVESNRNMNG